MTRKNCSRKYFNEQNDLADSISYPYNILCLSSVTNDFIATVSVRDIMAV